MMDDPKKRQIAAQEPAEPSPTPAMDPAMAQMIAAAVAAAMAPVVAAIGAIVEGQNESAAEHLKMAKAGKRPESYKGDFPYHERSHFRPQGIAGPPLPKLTCETFLGYTEYDDLTGALKIIPGYPYIADEHGGCTFEERELLNAIQPGVYRGITRLDGTTAEVRVKVLYDADGTPTRKTIAVPKQWLTKQAKNQIGGLQLLKQLADRVPKPEPVPVEEAVA